MVKSKSQKRKEAKKRIENTIEILQQQINSLKIDLRDFSDSESSVESQIEIKKGDKVESITAPWHNEIVQSTSSNKYWVFIKVGKEIKKKAIHNVWIVEKK